MRTLRDEDAALTLDQIAAGATSRCLLCWISLMRGGNEPGIIERWKQVASQEPNKEHRANYGAIVTVFAELTGCAGHLEVGSGGLGHAGIDDRGGVEGGGSEPGGRPRGIAEGEPRPAEVCCEVLEQRFGAPIPPDLVATIEEQADIDVLSRWFKTALKAETLDAFRAELAR